MKFSEKGTLNQKKLQNSMRQMHQGTHFLLTKHAFIPEKKHLSVQKEITLVSAFRSLQKITNMKEMSQEKNDWTLQDEKRLFQLQLSYGNKWSIISTHMPGKSDSSIKNKFYSTLRKGFRKMNKYITNIRRKTFRAETSVNKLLKPEFLTKLTAIADRNFQQKYQVKQTAINFSQNIQQKLLQLAQNTNDYENKDQKDFKFEEDLLSEIQQFNRNCKKRKGKRKRKAQNKLNPQFQSQSVEQSENLSRENNQLNQKSQVPEPRIQIRQDVQIKILSYERKEQPKNAQVLPLNEVLKQKSSLFNPEDELNATEYLHLQDNFTPAYGAQAIKTPSYSVISNTQSFANMIDPSPWNVPASFNQASTAFQGMTNLQLSRNLQSQVIFRSFNWRQREKMNFFQKIPMVTQSNQSSVLFNSAQLSKISDIKIQESQKKLSSSMGYEEQKGFSSFMRYQIDNQTQLWQANPMKKKMISTIQEIQGQQQREVQEK